MSAVHALTRLAVRECRRRPWRSLLVALLIAVPTAAVTVAAIALRTVVDTHEERVQRQMGAADLLVVDAAGLSDDARARLTPAGSRVLRHRQSQGFARVGSGTEATRLQPLLVDLRLDDPLATGLFVLVDGRSATRPGEVTASPHLLKRAGVTIGGTLALSAPPRTVTITGAAVAPSGTQTDLLIGPGLASDRPGAVFSDELLVDLPAGSRVEITEADRAVLRSDVASTASGGNDTLYLYLFGGLGLAAFGLVVASALAIGARRQLRMLGLLGTHGGSPRAAGTLVLLQGAVLGSIGAVAGLLAGLAVARPLVDVFGDTTDRYAGPLRIELRDLVVILTFALLVAIGASLLPARLARRTSVLTALAGRRPVAKLGLRVPALGIVIGALGAVALAMGVAMDTSDDTGSVVAIVGITGVIAGLVVCAPYLVGLLERVGGATSGPLRLAARTLARQRSRTGPTVAAVLACGALALAAATVALSIDISDRERVASEVPEIPVGPDGAQIGGIVGGATNPRNQVEVTGIIDDGTSTVPLTCATFPVEIADRIQAAVPSATRRCLDFAIGALAPYLTLIGGPDVFNALADPGLHTDYDAGSAITLGVPGTPPTSTATATVDGKPVTFRVVASRRPSLRSGALLISPATATRLGVRTESHDMFMQYTLDRPLTRSERSALSELSRSDLGAAVSRDGHDVYAYVAFQDTASSTVRTIVYGVLLPIAIVLALLATLVGLALTAAETRDERAVFVAVGAGPAHRRRQNAWQAAMVTGLGMLLAIPGGLIPAAILIRQDATAAFHTPWLALLALAIGLPLLAATGAALLTRGGLSPLTRRAA